MFTYSAMLNNFGIALSGEGRYPEAIEKLRHALKLQPRFPKARYNLGDALYGKHCLDGAIAEYREALRLKPDFAEAHFNLGFVLAEKGDLDGAIAEYREALRLKPDDASAHNNIGYALFQKRDMDTGDGNRLADVANTITNTLVIITGWGGVRVLTENLNPVAAWCFFSPHLGGTVAGKRGKVA